MNNDRFKFRVWDKENNKYEDDLYYEAGDLQVACVNKIFEEYISDGYIIEQCTSLKDKNEKLIYENDYIENDNTKEDVYLVVFDEKTARFMAKETNGNLRLINKNVRVVGNIHEKEEE